MKRVLWIIIFLPTLSLADFKGDGEYSVSTDKDVFLWFDLSSYELVLPLFPLNKKETYMWQFKGYCAHRGFSLDFETVSPTAQAWSKDSTDIDIEMTDESGKSVFKRSGKLNNYQVTYRNRHCKTITFQECPTFKNEWTTDYYSMSDYGGELHEASSIVLYNNETEVKKNSHHYYNVVHNENLGCGSYIVVAKVNQLFWSQNVQGESSYCFWVEVKP